MPFAKAIVRCGVNSTPNTSTTESNTEQCSTDEAETSSDDSFHLKLVDTCRQLSGLVLAANHLFGELLAECRTVVERTNRISRSAAILRTTLTTHLEIKINHKLGGQEGCTKDVVASLDHSTWSSPLRLFDAVNRPESIQILYNQSDANPSQVIQQLDVCRTDGLKGAPIFSPMIVVQCPCDIRPLQIKKSPARPVSPRLIKPMTVATGTILHHKTGTPILKNRPKSMPFIHSADVASSDNDDSSTTDSFTPGMSSFNSATLVNIDITGGNFSRKTEIRTLTGIGSQENIRESTRQRKIREQRRRTVNCSKDLVFCEINIDQLSPVGSSTSMAAPGASTKGFSCSLKSDISNSVKHELYAPVEKSSAQGRRTKMKEKSLIISWTRSLKSIFNASRSKSDLWAENWEENGGSRRELEQEDCAIKRSMSLPRSLKSANKKSVSIAQTRSSSVEGRLNIHPVSKNSQSQKLLLNATANDRPIAGERLGRKLNASQIMRSTSMMLSKSKKGSLMSSKSLTSIRCRPESVEIDMPAFGENGRLISPEFTPTRMVSRMPMDRLSSDSILGVESNRRCEQVEVDVPGMPWTRPFSSVRLRPQTCRQDGDGGYQSSSGHWSGSSVADRQSFDAESVPADSPFFDGERRNTDSSRQAFGGSLRNSVVSGWNELVRDSPVNIESTPDIRPTHQRSTPKFRTFFDKLTDAESTRKRNSLIDLESVDICFDSDSDESQEAFERLANKSKTLPNRTGLVKATESALKHKPSGGSLFGRLRQFGQSFREKNRASHKSPPNTQATSVSIDVNCLTPQLPRGREIEMAKLVAVVEKAAAAKSRTGGDWNSVKTNGLHSSFTKGRLGSGLRSKASDSNELGKYMVVVDVESTGDNIGVGEILHTSENTRNPLACLTDSCAYGNKTKTLCLNTIDSDKNCDCNTTRPISSDSGYSTPVIPGKDNTDFDKVSYENENTVPSVGYHASSSQLLACRSPMRTPLLEAIMETSSEGDDSVRMKRKVVDDNGSLATTQSAWPVSLPTNSVLRPNSLSGDMRTGDHATSIKSLDYNGKYNFSVRNGNRITGLFPSNSTILKNYSDSILMKENGANIVQEKYLPRMIVRPKSRNGSDVGKAEVVENHENSESKTFANEQFGDQKDTFLEHSGQLVQNKQTKVLSENDLEIFDKDLRRVCDSFAEHLNPVPASARLIISSAHAERATFVENPHKRSLCSPISSEDLLHKYFNSEQSQNYLSIPNGEANIQTSSSLIFPTAPFPGNSDENKHNVSNYDRSWYNRADSLTRAQHTSGEKDVLRT